MILFSGKTSEDRKTMYIANVEGAWSLWQKNQVPMEWAGFVLHQTRQEFLHYFKEDIDTHLRDGLVKSLNDYQYSIEHGGLYKTLMNKFDIVRY